VRRREKTIDEGLTRADERGETEEERGGRTETDGV